MTIVLGDVTFQDFGTSGWVYSTVKDWQGQVGNKAPRTARPQAHGNFPVDRVLRDSRAISWTATYLGETAAEAKQEVDRLSAIGAEAAVLMTVVEDDGTATWRMVTVETVTVDDSYSEPEITVHVGVVADDPRRYVSGAWQETAPPSAGLGEVWPEVYPVVWPGGGSSGRVALVNTGRAPSRGLLRLYGGFSSALVTCVETGGRVGLDRPVPAGHFVEISVGSSRPAGGRALLDGISDVSRWLRFREWSDVPGLVTRNYQFDVTDPVGSPVMRGKVDPAWW